MVLRSAKGCRMFIEPTGLTDFGMFDLSRGADIQRIGYEYTRELLSKQV